MIIFHAEVGELILSARRAKNKVKTANIELIKAQTDLFKAAEILSERQPQSAENMIREAAIAEITCISDANELTASAIDAEIAKLQVVATYTETDPEDTQQTTLAKLAQNVIDATRAFAAAQAEWEEVEAMLNTAIDSNAKRIARNLLDAKIDEKFIEQAMGIVELF